MPRKVKTAFTATDEDRAITGIHDVAFIPRDPRRRRGFEMRVGGGTSIMPRVAPTLYDFVERRRRRVPAGHRGRHADLRPPGLAARKPRPRPHQGASSTSIGIDELRQQVEEELEGDWVAERDFSVEHRLFIDDEEAKAPPVPAGYSSAQRRPARVRALPRLQRAPPAPGRLLHRRRSRCPAATSRPSSSAGWPRSCATTPAATPARPSSRTSCCAGCATRRSTTSGAAWSSSTSASTARTRSPTSSAAPAPTPASSASPARWASTPPFASGCARWRSATR